MYACNPKHIDFQVSVDCIALFSHVHFMFIFKQTRILQQRGECLRFLFPIVCITSVLTNDFNKYHQCNFIYFSLILKQRVRNNINCYKVLISGLTYYKQNDCHHNNMSYTISDNRLKLALERVITLTIIIIDCKL